MNKTEIVLSFEMEKLDALNFFLAKEETTPQQVLAQTLDELYQQRVPAELREYIESRNAPATQARSRAKKQAKPARAADAKLTDKAGEGNENGQP